MPLAIEVQDDVVFAAHALFREGDLAAGKAAAATGQQEQTGGSEKPACNRPGAFSFFARPVATGCGLLITKRHANSPAKARCDDSASFGAVQESLDEGAAGSAPESPATRPRGTAATSSGA